jgi:hypothetical protein
MSTAIPYYDLETIRAWAKGEPCLGSNSIEDARRIRFLAEKVVRLIDHHPREVPLPPLPRELRSEEADRPE